jgi:hypothetical protein
MNKQDSCTDEWMAGKVAGVLKISKDLIQLQKH